MIEIKNLTKVRYEKGKQIKIFKDFNLFISKGEKVGLFGANGVGKSTILDIIVNLDTDFTGFIKIDSKNISYVHQNIKDTLLPWMTCEENIFKFLDYKENVNISKKYKLYEALLDDLDIDFEFSKKTSELSGGQKQVVSFIMSVIQEPDIIFLDEPFSAIDSDRRDRMIYVLKKYLPKTTAIICSHRGNEVADYINRVIVFNNQPTTVTQDFVEGKSSNFKELVNKISFSQYEK